MIDKTAFHALSYGLYIISSEADGEKAGCVANTFQQVTSTPLQVSVALNKDNVTTAVIREAGRFAAVCLSQEATMELIGAFGFRCSREFDKFGACRSAVDAAGMPYVAEQGAARFSVRVAQEVDLGTHILFVGEVEEAERMDASEPMTYAYYHRVKGGKTPPKASSYLPGDGESSRPGAEGAACAAAGEGADALATGAPAPGMRIAWRCTICGHVEYVDELPDDFACPLCGMGKEMFERIEVPAE